MSAPFKEAQHPRGPNGRFTRSFARIMSALDRKKRDKAKHDFTPKGLKGPDDARTYLSHLSGTKGPQIREHIASGALGRATEALRAGKADVPEMHQIDAAMHPLPDGLDLYRSVPAKKFGAVDPKSLDGMKVSDAGYFPTTIAPQKAGPGTVQLHVQAPAGTPAAVDPDSGQVVLGHGTEMAVDSVEVGPDGSTRMDLVALPQSGEDAPSPDQPAPPDQAAGPEPNRDLHDLITAGIPSIVENDAGAQERRRRAREALAPAIEGEFGGLQVRIGNPRQYWGGPDEESPGFAVSYTIHDAEGNEVGHGDRAFYRGDDGNLAAVHELLTLDPEVQGSGFAAAFNGNLTNWYRDQGVSRVELIANVDVGGYAWASNGYDFVDEDSAARVLRRLRGRLEGADGPSAEAGRDILRRAESEPFGSAGYPTAFEISQIGRPPNLSSRVAGETGQSWLGRDVMLGSVWEGVRWL